MTERFFEQKIIDFRRQLHRIPELGFDLQKTRKFLLSVLDSLNCEIRDLGKGGFTAFFPCENAVDSETIAFRSDMDALPIVEPDGYAFRSEHAGAMHACGHDGHMSMLLGLALWVSEHKDELSVNCLLVFQAAEETTGGAKLITDTGVLEYYKVSRIYGLHLWPTYPKNTIVCRPKDFMAGTFVLNITVDGRSAHIAEYQESIDALEVGCRFILQAYAFEKTLPADVYRLLRFGRFVSGTTGNIISDKTLISGAIRAYDDKTFDYIEDGFARIMYDLENETGVKFQYAKSEGYPPVINPPDLYNQTRDILTDTGFAWLEPEKPILQAEDFSYYQHKVPGLYMFLGTGTDTKLHTPEYTLDENVLMTGVSIMQTLLGKRADQR